MENREELQQAYNEKMAECRELVIKIKELEQSIEGLKSRNESLNGRIAAREEEKISSSAIIKELEDKCRDMESSFFDLQMENIQLKGELDHIKKSLNK